MAKGIYLDAKDMMILEGYKHYDNALNKLKVICAALGKPKITKKQYAEYMQVDIEEINEALEPKPKKSFS